MQFVQSKLSFSICAALFPVFAFAENENTQVEVTFNTIVVEAKKTDAIGQTTYSKEDLEKTPNSSKNITDFLKVNPNVQFDHSVRSGLNQGELSASDISINGSQPYENKILINGMSINNNINPIGAKESNDPNSLMGSSQTVAVNTDLLCSITVLDSNVSAEYGEFTGGVVSAETCKPATAVGKIHGSISYDYTSDHWSKINFSSPEEQSNFEESTTESNQPFFTKQGISANIYGNLSEQLGFNAFGSFRNSDIPLKTTLKDPTAFEQNRTASNAGLELFYTPNDKTALKIGTQFFENDGKYFKANIKDSESTHRSDSQSIYTQLDNYFDQFQLTQQLNYQNQTAERNAALHSYSWAKSAAKDWSTLNGLQQQGHLGDLKQQEEKIEYSIKTLFKPITTVFGLHNFKIGAGYGHYNASSERANNTYVYSSRTDTTSCVNGTEELIACDDSSTKNNTFGQRMTYLAHEIDVSQDRVHLFAEDNVQFNNYLSTTLGLRADYDSLTKDMNLAPRSSFSYRPFGDQRLHILTGWNRYYGLNSFSNELLDRVDQYQIRENRQKDSAGLWTNNWTEDQTYAGPTATYRSDLKTPHSDEIVLGLNGEYQNLNWGLKWVNRNNKDQLKQTILEKNSEITGNISQNTKSYDNSGRSASDIYTFNIKNIEALQFKNSQHYFSLAANYSQSARNFETYAASIINGTAQAMYDGKLIDAEDVPSSNYNIPWTVRATWNIGFNNFPLQISNFLSYKSTYDVMKKISYLHKDSYKDESGNAYDTYVPFENKSAFSWDIRTAYKLPIAKQYEGVLGLTINNLTNKNNTITATDGTSSPEIGRQFIADVTFKF